MATSNRDAAKTMMTGASVLNWKNEVRADVARSAGEPFGMPPNERAFMPKSSWKIDKDPASVPQVIEFATNDGDPYLIRLSVDGRTTEVAVLSTDTASTIALFVEEALGEGYEADGCYVQQKPGARVRGRVEVERVDLETGIAVAGRGFVVMPADATFEVVSPQPNPQPAPSQVWVPPEGEFRADLLAADGTLTVDKVHRERAYLGPHICVATSDMLRPASGWRCIGVATMYGRVMVGDGFYGTPGLTVVEVVAGTILELRDSSGWETNAEATDVLDHKGKCGHRTRYAPARVGERYRERKYGDVLDVLAVGAIVKLGDEYENRRIFGGTDFDGSLDPALWRRLDPVQAKLRDVLPTETSHLTRAEGIPTPSPEPTDEERIHQAILDRRGLDLGIPQREGEPLVAYAARLDREEPRIVLRRAARSAPPQRVVAIGVALEGGMLSMPIVRALLAALDAVDGLPRGRATVQRGVDAFRRASGTTGPLWLREAMERAVGAPPVPVPVEPRGTRASGSAWSEVRDAAARGDALMSPPKLSVPVLHGLTDDQLEATRGYCETVASVLMLRMQVSQLLTSFPAERPPISSLAPLRANVKSIADMDHFGGGAYEDGARYALTTSRCRVAWEEIDEALKGWKR